MHGRIEERAKNVRSGELELPPKRSCERPLNSPQLWAANFPQF